MPDLKISQLPAALTPLAGTELVPVVQGGITERTTVGDLLTSTVPSGTANGVMYLNGSKTATSGSALTFDGNTLATSTTSSAIANLFSTNAAGGEVGVGSGTFRAIVGSNFSAATTYFGSATNHPVLFLQNGTEQMRLTSTGLGIGTSSPGAKLEVTGTGSSTNPIAVVASSTGPYLGFGVTNSSYSWIQGFSSLPLYINPQGNNTIINSASGNVGIGTTSPGTKFDVKLGSSGDFVRVQGAASGSSNLVLQGNAGSGSAWWLSGKNAGYLAIGGNGGAEPASGALNIDTSGNVGVGTSTPGYKLHAYATGAVAHFGEGVGLAGITFSNRLTSLPTTGTVANIAWLDSGSGFPAGSLLLGARPAIGNVVLSASGAADTQIDPSGNIIQKVNGTAPTLSTNSTMSFELTSNTSLKIVVRGTDGVTRSATLTLA